jgi:peptide methionine sulfoxide reductase msrA/msrB
MSHHRIPGPTVARLFLTVLLAGIATFGCARRSSPTGTPVATSATSAPRAATHADAGGRATLENPPMADRVFPKPADGELRKRLTPLEYEVTQHDATEPPFSNRYGNNHEAGLYVDVVSGEPLFSSTDKFDSGTGWPSFTRPAAPGAVSEHTDRSLFFIKRIEVRCARCDAHLGDVFPDGPQPTGLRYCMNGVALELEPEAN